MHTRAATRALVRAVMFVAAFGVAACGDSKSPTEGGNSSLVATWDMRSVDGENLPVTETEDLGEGVSCTFTLNSASIAFNSNGRYSSTFNVAIGCTGIPTQTFVETTGGTWRTSGNQLYMKQDADEGGPYEEEAATYAINGRMLTVTTESEVIVLERR